MTPQTIAPVRPGVLARRSFLAAAVAGTTAVAVPTVAFAGDRKVKAGTSYGWGKGKSGGSTPTEPTPTDPTPTEPTPTDPPSTGATPAFLGHQPGRLYLGQSYPGDIADAEAQARGRFGVHRTFYQWDGGDKEDARIREAHANGRLPWVSFKPPGGGTATWSAVGAGTYDADLRVRARRYAGYTKPVIVTFHHEPTNDSPDGAAWASAFVRIHDIFKAEGALDVVSFVPIIQEWAWNPYNSKNAWPERYLTSKVMWRMPFLGIDCYENNSGEGFEERLGRVRSWMAERGFGDKMLGIAETSSSNYFGPDMAVKWWNEQFAWCAANTDKVAILSHFNHPWPTYNWHLAETSAKVDAFRRSLADPVTCRLDTMAG